MKRRFLRLALMLAIVPVLAVAACKGSSPSNLQPCRCGTPESDVFGCTAACAVEGAACDNPKCTCHPAKK